MDIIGVTVQLIQNQSYTMINNLSSYIANLLYVLCMIDLIFNVSFNILEPKSNPFVELAYNCFKYSFIGFVINNYRKVLEVVIGGGIQLGNMALGKGNNTYFSSDLFNYLYEYLWQALGVFGTTTLVSIGSDLLFVESLPTGLILCAMGLVLFFFWTFVKVIMAIGKVFFITAFAYPFLPFIVFTKTKDIGMKAFSSILNSAIYMFVLTALLNVYQVIYKEINKMFPTVDQSALTTINNLFSTILFSSISSFLMVEFISNAEVIAGIISSGTLSTLTAGGKGAVGYFTDSKNMFDKKKDKKKQNNDGENDFPEIPQLENKLGKL